MNEEGKVQCPVCKGISYYTLETFCKHCCSNGKLDWISNAKGGMLNKPIWIKICENCGKVSFIMLRKPQLGATIFAENILKPNGSKYSPGSKVSCFFCGDDNVGNMSKMYAR